MWIDKISNVLNGFFTVLSGINGVGVWLFLIGFTILMIIGLSIAITILIRAVKEIPNLTVSQFIKLTVITAIVLMIIGIFIP
ncbi:hypothetical protein [Desulfurococcus amylolyticus]|uniref:Uncharacterized protein n=1 Tax=Desulfurococcus amylolyticus (strain DSM 18924 / JCM 16383 / VKM B-2413 / 1221n) TaxID=490899 RepID=B8D6N6_DESA1|nr:hypothetical protein [Desulfurococcus amylolyticus]ACL11767.1 hypothetical protein DKAM_1441 [Desulfurococcus amylolyticus 1221n]